MSVTPIGTLGRTHWLIESEADFNHAAVMLAIDLDIRRNQSQSQLVLSRRMLERDTAKRDRTRARYLAERGLTLGPRR